MDLIGFASAAGQVASALFAIPAGVIAYFAWRTSVNSAKATDQLTKIEATRLRGERRPQFALRAELLKSPGDKALTLWLTLAGPLALLRLERVVIRVQPMSIPVKDGNFDWRVPPTDFYPYLFVAVPGTSRSASSEPRPINLGEETIFFMETPPESKWFISAGWGKMNLLIDGEVGGESWTVPATVSILFPELVTGRLASKRSQSPADSANPTASSEG